MISICYSGNRAYFEGLLMSVLSVIKHTESPITFYILTMNLEKENPRYLDFTDEQIALLDKLAKEKNPSSKAIKIDLTQLYIKHLLEGKNHKCSYTPYTLLRLLLDLIDDIPDKLIYLDVDTMCCSDIKQLHEIDVEDYDYCAVKDYMGRFWINRKYCNSGVMLLNMKQIKENKLLEKSRKKVFECKMVMPDQTALNKFGKKKYLPFKFNEQRKIKKDTVVKHFCKGIVFYLPFGFHIYNIKQWQREKVHKSLKIHDFDDIYEKVDQLKSEYKYF